MKRDTRILISESHGLAYCPIPKNACTSLKYWVAQLNGVAPASIKELHEKKPTHMIPLRDFIASSCYMQFTRFVVIRDPLDRLASAYCNKIVSADLDSNQSHNAGYWIKIATTISQDSNRTFDQFVDFVKPGSGLPFHDDIHWAHQHELCAIDQIQYHYLIDFSYLKPALDALTATLSNPPQLPIPTLNCREKKTHTISKNGLSIRARLDPTLTQSSLTPISDLGNADLMELVRRKYSRDYALYHQAVEQTRLLIDAKHPSQ